MKNVERIEREARSYPVWDVMRMTTGKQNTMSAALKTEIMLQVNQRLYEAGLITQGMYEFAKIKIVDGT